MSAAASSSAVLPGSITSSPLQPSSLSIQPAVGSHPSLASSSASSAAPPASAEKKKKKAKKAAIIVDSEEEDLAGSLSGLAVGSSTTPAKKNPLPDHEQSDQDEEEDEDDSTDAVEEADAADAEPSSIAELTGELEDLTNALDSIVFGEHLDVKPTKQDIKKLLVPYGELQDLIQRMCSQFKLTMPAKSKSDRKSGGGSGGGGSGQKVKKEEEEKEEDRIKFIREIEEEVKLLALKSEDRSFQQRVTHLAEAIQKSLSDSNINFNVEKLGSIDSCDLELNKVSKIITEVKKLLLSLRIHEGFLWLRQQQLAQAEFDKGQQLHLPVNGKMESIGDIVKFKVYQQEKYFSNRDNISRAIALAKISQDFPEIINSEKSWSWFRRAISNDKLMDAIKKQQGEK